MANQIENADSAPAASFTADMQLLFRFLAVSSPSDLDGKTLEDRLLTSSALALHQSAPTQ